MKYEISYSTIKWYQACDRHPDYSIPESMQAAQPFILGISLDLSIPKSRGGTPTPPHLPSLNNISLSRKFHHHIDPNGVQCPLFLGISPGAQGAILGKAGLASLIPPRSPTTGEGLKNGFYHG